METNPEEYCQCGGMITNNERLPAHGLNSHFELMYEGNIRAYLWMCICGQWNCRNHYASHHNRSQMVQGKCFNSSHPDRVQTWDSGAVMVPSKRTILNADNILRVYSDYEEFCHSKERCQDYASGLSMHRGNEA